MTTPISAITLEEHVAFPSLDIENDPFYGNIWKIFPERLHHAKDISTTRLANMDAGNISYQILSHLPDTIALTSPSHCRAANDEMAAAIAQHPTRFGGFAALPMSDPAAAATELHHAITDLHFHGALIDNHLPDGTHYDAEHFWPVFAAAEALDVPIYLHPSPPTNDYLQSRFSGNYPLTVELGLATGAWGWHENVGLHVLKLYAAGVFERFPRLKIIIGHMGELLPIMLHRIVRLRFFEEMEKKRGKGILDVWNENVWVTTSGIFSVETLDMVLRVTKKERIMFSVDYPFEDNVTGRRFLEELRERGELSGEEVQGIAEGNVRALLGLKG
ncbi:2,3-dihydroxybenzoic acid decarboxylase [Aspergillus ellipticus CBS 707.79]|uniref:2,3-dihydroxybenzoic acid decarboxylase n=1 Tax=Aspergillus ellipticus CBS 707.79 TaxID=1448320 RepID=A0A319D479_9EURO|nr:2,3-dihydroxybenzoic acid decarboxylase [Aspergillus ellipticus CBS 707.79]